MSSNRHPGPSTACKAGAQDKLQPKVEGRDLALNKKSRFATSVLRYWVPAFAGMTAVFAIPALAQQDTKIENPFRGVMQDRTSRSADERLYVEKCSMCHRQMGMGTVILARRMDPKIARLEARSDLTAEYITLTVRQGIGNMPRISRAEVSDPELARIRRYLLKNNGETVK